MEIFLTHNRPDGVTVDLVKLTDQVFDLFTVTGSKEQVEFWIDTFMPVYQLLPGETSKLENSDLYSKSAFVHKSRSMDFEIYLFEVFRGGSRVSNN